MDTLGALSHVELPCPKPGCDRRVRVPAGKIGIATCTCPDRHTFPVNTRGLVSALRIAAVGIIGRLRLLARAPAPLFIASMLLLWACVLSIYHVQPTSSPFWFAGAAALAAGGCEFVRRHAKGDPRAV